MILLGIVSGCLVTGCDDPSGSSRADPVAGLPPCKPTPSPERTIRVRGLVAPDGTVVTSAKPSGERLTNVRGFVEMTPIEIRRFYGAIRARGRHDFFLLEDEVIEAEAFLSDGRYRTYLRARAVCPTRSDVFAIVAPEDYDKKFPLPRRTSVTPGG